MKNGSGTGMRLLPWVGPEGRPRRVAMTPEARAARERRLAQGALLLESARAALYEQGTPAPQVRALAGQLCTALGDAPRAAESRGRRPADGTEDTRTEP